MRKGTCPLPSRPWRGLEKAKGLEDTVARRNGTQQSRRTLSASPLPLWKGLMSEDRG